MSTPLHRLQVALREYDAVVKPAYDQYMKVRARFIMWERGILCWKLKVDLRRKVEDATRVYGDVLSFVDHGRGARKVEHPDFKSTFMPTPRTYPESYLKMRTEYEAALASYLSVKREASATLNAARSAYYVEVGKPSKNYFRKKRQDGRTFINLPSVTLSNAYRQASEVVNRMYYPSMDALDRSNARVRSTKK